MATKTQKTHKNKQTFIKGKLGVYVGCYLISYPGLELNYKLCNRRNYDWNDVKETLNPSTNKQTKQALYLNFIMGLSALMYS